MSVTRWELPAASLVPPGAGATGGDAGVLRRLAMRARLPRPTTVLAPTLPGLMLLGLCIAGLSDPPDPPAHGSGTVSRLHVSTAAPDSPGMTRGVVVRAGGAG